jgi:uncharacterized protein YbjQ (UPF0145 family)
MSILATNDSSPVWFLFILPFELLLPLVFLVGTWLIGRAIERKHFREIAAREARLAHIPTVNSKTLDPSLSAASSKMVVGSVVISVDHFKRFLTAFRKFFGGEMKSYTSVIERGRREAILRMKESCPDADLFLNCRLETSTISNGTGKATGCAEILAYATAVRFTKG